MNPDKRTVRNYGTSEVVVGFARYGVALATIARALVINTEQARSICERACNRGELQRLPPELPTDDVRSSMLTELVHLRDSLDVSRTLIRELQAAERETVAEFIGVANMTPHEATLIGLLVKHGRVSKARIYDAMYGMRHDDAQPGPKIVDVHVCKSRRKLKPHGIDIETIWGVGYEMTPENAAKLRAVALREPTRDHAYFADRATVAGMAVSA